MTIAIAMKINDGIILATDSFSTILIENDNGEKLVTNTYNNADKIFNLIKGLPIGVLTWGDGSINNESVSTLTKDFRKNFNKNNYSSVEDTVNEFKSFLNKKDISQINMGFLVAGYSLDNNFPELFILKIHDGIIEIEEISKNDPVAISWFGETKFLSRFLLCYDDAMIEIFRKNGISQDKINDIMGDYREYLQLPMGVPAMPIQDAIDLVKFLAEFSVNSSKFIQSAQIIGGPIDIAVITKHEGFKWVQRKHYYNKELNLTTGD